MSGQRLPTDGAIGTRVRINSSASAKTFPTLTLGHKRVARALIRVYILMCGNNNKSKNSKATGHILGGFGWLHRLTYNWATGWQHSSLFGEGNGLHRTSLGALKSGSSRSTDTDARTGAGVRATTLSSTPSPRSRLGLPPTFALSQLGFCRSATSSNMPSV